MTDADTAEQWLDTTGPEPADPVHDDWVMDDLEEPRGWIDRTDGSDVVMKYTGKRVPRARFTWAGLATDAYNGPITPVTFWVIR